MGEELDPGRIGRMGEATFQLQSEQAGLIRNKSPIDQMDWWSRLRSVSTGRPCEGEHGSPVGRRRASRQGNPRSRFSLWLGSYPSERFGNIFKSGPNNRIQNHLSLHFLEDAGVVLV